MTDFTSIFSRSFVRRIVFSFLLVTLLLNNFGDMPFAASKKKVLDPVVKLDIEIKKPMADPIKGELFINLYISKAPVSVKNFLDYAREGFYDGLIFHRLLDDFVVQGGGYDPSLKLKPTRPPIKNESLNKLSNEQWTLAMARSTKINSATSQFFINLANNEFLDHRGTSQRQYGYAVFGKVVDGTEFLKKIIKTPVTRKGIHNYVPVYDIVVSKVTILQDISSNNVSTTTPTSTVPSLKKKGVQDKTLFKRISKDGTSPESSTPPVITPNMISTESVNITANLSVSPNTGVSLDMTVSPNKVVEVVTPNSIATPPSINTVSNPISPTSSSQNKITTPSIVTENSSTTQNVLN